jgi:hypothetical protein
MNINHISDAIPREGKHGEPITKHVQFKWLNGITT